ncbi:MAG: hypothetical protein QG588_1611 [Candidatus Poribacteria bacterium]|nr:hypothetical protein [Candidatus Poribacteria bacterium]
MANSNRAIIATSLSIIPGVGHIYLHQILKGFILFLSFVIAIGIIWLAISHKEFKMLSLNGKEIMFNPAMKAISFGGKGFKMTDVMKVTGTIQLAFTWVYGIVNAWREGKNQSG